MEDLLFCTISGTSLDPYYLLQSYTSIIWREDWTGVGLIEIYCEASQDNVQNITADSVVLRKGTKKAGIIRDVRLIHDQTDGVMLVATGYSVKDVLAQRIIYSITESGGEIPPTSWVLNVERCARDLVSLNVIDPVYATAITPPTPDENRQIPVVQLGPSNGYSDVFEARPTPVGENLLYFLQNSLKDKKMSCNLLVELYDNPDDNLDDNPDYYYLSFVVQKGTDRSNNVLISGTLDNVIDSSYERSTVEEKTTLLTTRSVDSSRTFTATVVGADVSGIHRKEMLFESSSVPSQIVDKDALPALFPGGSFNTSEDRYRINGKLVAIKIDNSEDWYVYFSFLEPLMTEPGLSELQNHKAIRTFSGEIDVSSGTYKLNKDYFLGDYVRIYDERLGVTAKVQIIETTEVQDTTGSLTTAVFETVEILS